MSTGDFEPKPFTTGIPVATELMPEPRRYSRREVLAVGGTVVGTVAVLGGAAALGIHFSNENSHHADGAPANPSTTGEPATTAITPTTNEARRVLPELVLPVFDFKEILSTEELLDFARSTDYGTNNPRELQQLDKKLEVRASSDSDTKVLAAGMIQDMTGVGVYYDTDLTPPIIDNRPTGGPLPLVRPPRAPGALNKLLRDGVQMFGKFPEAMSSKADGYNLVTQRFVNTDPATDNQEIMAIDGIVAYEFGPDGTTSIRAHMGMEVEAIAGQNTIRHELVHVKDGPQRDKIYGRTDTYSRYRDEVGEKLGGGKLVSDVAQIQSVEEWLAAEAARGTYNDLKIAALREIALAMISNNKRAPGPTSDKTAQLEHDLVVEAAAGSLDDTEIAGLAKTAKAILDEKRNAPHVVNIEDEAQTFEHTLAYTERYSNGLLPANSGNEVIEYLRTKQLLALHNMKEFTGVDAYKMARFNATFGTNLHPKLIVSLYDAGVNNHMAPSDSSPFEQWAEAPKKDVTPEGLGLRLEEQEGSLLYDIGTPDKPSLITLKKYYSMDQQVEGSSTVWYLASASFPVPNPSVGYPAPEAARIAYVGGVYEPLAYAYQTDIASIQVNNYNDRAEPPAPGTPANYTIYVDAEKLFSDPSRIKSVMKEGVFVPFNPQTDSTTLIPNS